MRQQAGESGARMGFGGPGHLPTVGSEGLAWPLPPLIVSRLLVSHLSVALCRVLGLGLWVWVSISVITVPTAGLDKEVRPAPLAGQAGWGTGWC